MLTAHTVPMMARIYGQAQSVCVWIGVGDEYSKVAFDFIKDEVLRLQHFDELCENKDYGHKWRALLNVMKRTWFSRRWVVQEIALAQQATIYCGDDTISWTDFSDAVQLFVEVETATHRLSEVMKMDPDFYHIPGWFEYVSALGASLLVEATGTLFRKIKNQDPQPLRSLEYLVSSMTVFQATIPHDTIYSLLAIAKDTAPTPVIRTSAQTSHSAHPGTAGILAWADRHNRKRKYDVDYEQPLVDVCKDFIVFCIHQSDPTRALDIICRPWAPTLNAKRRKKKHMHGKLPKHIHAKEEYEKMPTWVPTLAGAANAMYEHANGEWKMGRINADPLVGLPEYTQRNYSAAGTKPIDMLGLRFKKSDDHFSMFVSGFICDEIDEVEEPSQSGNIPSEWIDQGGWDELEEDPPQELWRTLVADRGRNGRNPPTYYARACKESIQKGLKSGSLNTTELINDGRCSVVAEFFRRVQAVIWNRRLMRTKNNALGMVGKSADRKDLICVLYGCSVPVILRRHQKSQDEIHREDKEHVKDQYAAAAKLLEIYKGNRGRRQKQKESKPARAKTNSPPYRAPNGPMPGSSEPTPDADAGNEQLPSNINGTDDAGKADRRPTPPAKPPSMSSQPVSKDNVEKNGVYAERRAHWYEFLGECYVYGMMDGEAIKKQNDENISAQLFELR